MNAIDAAIIERTVVDVMGEGDCDEAECIELKLFIFKLEAISSGLPMFLEPGEDDPELFEAVLMSEPRYRC